jgi:hypothetical protein
MISLFQKSGWIMFHIQAKIRNKSSGGTRLIQIKILNFLYFGEKNNSFNDILTLYSKKMLQKRLKITATEPETKRRNLTGKIVAIPIENSGKNQLEPENIQLGSQSSSNYIQTVRVYKLNDERERESDLTIEKEGRKYTKRRRLGRVRG